MDLPSSHTGFYQIYHLDLQDALSTIMVVHTALLLIRELTWRQITCGSGLMIISYYLLFEGNFSPMTTYFFLAKYRHTWFYSPTLYCTLQILCFLQIESLWQPSVEHIFPTAWTHFMSLCHILVIFAICQTFSL